MLSTLGLPTLQGKRHANGLSMNPLEKNFWLRRTMAQAIDFRGVSGERKVGIIRALRMEARHWRSQ